MIKTKSQSKNWRKLKLGEVLELKYGFGLTENRRSSGNVPVFGSSGMVGTHNKPAVESSGIIVGRKGHVGSVNYSEKPFYPIDTVYYVDQLKIPGDLKFFYYFLQRIPFQKIGSDVGVPGLNRDIAYGLEIVIPENITEQKRIASILSAFDDKIELNNKINQNLEQLAQVIFKEWFVKFRFPGHEKVKMVDLPVEASAQAGSELGKIPEGWEIKNLEEIVEIEYGKGPASKDLKSKGYPVYGANGIIGYHNDYEFENPQVIVGCRGVVGSLFKTLPKSSITHNSLILKPIAIEKFYLFYLLKQSNLQSIVGGSAQPQITIKDLSQLSVLFAKKEIRNKFEEIVSNLEDKLFNTIYENQKLASLRDLLLPKLMSGEIRV